ncbi:MAG: 50S ribosomal protein L10 [Nitrospinota bacterium]
MSVQAAKKGRLAAGHPPRPEKVEAVEALRTQLEKCSSMVLLDYRGLTVAQMTELRRRTRAAGVELAVVKNALLNRAVAGPPFEVVRPQLSGPISIAITTGDPAGPAKVLKNFLKDAPKAQLRGGAMADGKFLEVAEIQAIADLPSREVLLAQVLGTLSSVVAGLPRVLNAVLKKPLYALQAIAKEKEKV